MTGPHITPKPRRWKAVAGCEVPPHVFRRLAPFREQRLQGAAVARAIAYWLDSDDYEAFLANPDAPRKKACAKGPRTLWV